MADQLLSVASFVDVNQAELARTVLAAEGVESHIADATLVSMNWQLSNAVGGVKVLVAADDLENARTILTSSTVGQGELATGPTLVCTQCGAVLEPGFAVCWSCGTEIAAGSATESAAPIAADADGPLLSHADREVTRAWRAAIFGLLFFPPLLSLYAIAVLLSVARRGDPLSPQSSRRFYLALAVACTTVALAVGVLAMIAFPQIRAY